MHRSPLNSIRNQLDVRIVCGRTQNPVNKSIKSALNAMVHSGRAGSMADGNEEAGNGKNNQRCCNMIDESSLFVISPRIELYNFIFSRHFLCQKPIRLFIKCLILSIVSCIACLRKKRITGHPSHCHGSAMGFLL